LNYSSRETRIYFISLGQEQLDKEAKRKGPTLAAMLQSKIPYSWCLAPPPPPDRKRWNLRTAQLPHANSKYTNKQSYSTAISALKRTYPSFRNVAINPTSTRNQIQLQGGQAATSTAYTTESVVPYLGKVQYTHNKQQPHHLGRTPTSTPPSHIT
jgi:hypothetical protein